MLQDLADQLAAQGLSPSSVRNTILPLRAIYRRALNRGEVALDPTRKLTLPAVRTNRDRIAVPTEATALLAALPLTERALWAAALFAGLRMGELQALDWNHIDLDQNVMHIERSWDRSVGYIEPKSRSGKRRVPITNTLRRHLQSHRLQQGTGGHGLVFPNQRSDKPFNPSTTNQRAKTAWASIGLNPITLHECRHSYAAYMIAAGINTKALSTYMGHASVNHHPRPLRPPPPGQRTPSSRTRRRFSPSLEHLTDTLHGKEGVDGSSPSEGSHKSPATGRIVLPAPTNSRRFAGTRRVHFGTGGHSRARATSRDTVLDRARDTRSQPLTGKAPGNSRSALPALARS
jgi:site-specific recombinase XerD